MKTHHLFIFSDFAYLKKDLTYFLFYFMSADACKSYTLGLGVKFRHPETDMRDDIMALSTATSTSKQLI